MREGQHLAHVIQSLHRTTTIPRMWSHRSRRERGIRIHVERGGYAVQLNRSPSTRRPEHACESDPFDADATPLHVGCRGLVVDAILSREYSEHFGQQLDANAAFSTCTPTTRPTAESPSVSAAAATTATATCAAAATACDGQRPSNWRGCGYAAAPSRGGPGTARRG